MTERIELDGGNVVLYCADCLSILPTLAAGSVDAVVTDPQDGSDDAPALPQRRTLAELSADPDADGIKCPRCGCGHAIVASTWDIDGARRRRRVCRRCGRAWATTEK